MNRIDVLLVEDEAGDILLTRQVLANSLIPVNLHVARDGEQAVTMLSDPEFKPDLIILDLNIPKISGHQLLEQRKFRDVPVVVFSSSWNEIDVTRALESGAREYVRKPMDIDDFSNAVCGMVKKWGTRENGDCNGAAAG